MRKIRSVSCRFLFSVFETMWKNAHWNGLCETMDRSQVCERTMNAAERRAESSCCINKFSSLSPLFVRPFNHYRKSHNANSINVPLLPPNEFRVNRLSCASSYDTHYCVCRSIHLLGPGCVEMESRKMWCITGENVLTMCELTIVSTWNKWMDIFIVVQLHRSIAAHASVTNSNDAQCYLMALVVSRACELNAEFNVKWKTKSNIIHSFPSRDVQFHVFRCS